MTIDEPSDIWSRHARQWQLIGSPLRASGADARIYEDAVRQWHAANPLPAPRALLLGVTLEIAAMRWPAMTRLIAADHSWAMIRGLWTGLRQGYPAVCADWSQLPLADGTQDILIGDACFSALPHGDRYPDLVAGMRRVICGHGMVLMRFFVRPEMSETPSEVIDALLQERIGNFHVFKWRLAMSLHGTLAQGVRLADIWEAWHAAVPHPEQLASRTGWPLSTLLTIDAYRGLENRYTFPTLGEARAAMAQEFVETACVTPAYELGERCPVMSFRPRPAAGRVSR